MLAARDELNKVASYKTRNLEEQRQLIHNAAQMLTHTNSNIEYVMLAFGITKRSQIQKDLSIMITQLYRMAYSSDEDD